MMESFNNRESTQLVILSREDGEGSRGPGAITISSWSRETLVRSLSPLGITI